MSDERLGPGTYLTEAEAKEFHKLFITSFLVFTLVAVIAHFLVWSWKPWLRTADIGDVATHAKMAMTAVSSLLA